jgi:hypothetical protein
MPPYVVFIRALAGPRVVASGVPISDRQEGCFVRRIAQVGAHR